MLTSLLLAGVLAGELDAAGVRGAAATHKGRVVLVSFWATWCAPCLVEFPDLVALARERKDVRVISVSIDDPIDRAAVEEVVAKHKPPFPVYMKTAGKDAAFIDGIDPSWSGAVPATLILAPGGEKRAFIEGEKTRAELEKVLSVP
jgi:thiol-disulfide isomerase/thioredoxin